MGLDNYFVMKKKNEENGTVMGYFRKYYELDKWIRANCTPATADEDSVFIVTKEDFDKLKSEIKPIYDAIKPLIGNIEYYDDNGYPENIKPTTYGTSFDICEATSAFPGFKLIKLYENIDFMLEILDLNLDCSFEFISDY